MNWNPNIANFLKGYLYLSLLANVLFPYAYITNWRGNLDSVANLETAIDYLDNDNNNNSNKNNNNDDDLPHRSISVSKYDINMKITQRANFPYFRFPFSPFLVFRNFWHGLYDFYFK